MMSSVFRAWKYSKSSEKAVLTTNSLLNSFQFVFEQHSNVLDICGKFGVKVDDDNVIRRHALNPFSKNKHPTNMLG